MEERNLIQKVMRLTNKDRLNLIHKRICKKFRNWSVEMQNNYAKLILDCIEHQYNIVTIIREENLTVIDYEKEFISLEWMIACFT